MNALLIQCATEFEARPIRRLVGLCHDKVEVVRTGIGPVRVQKLLEQILEKKRPIGVVSCGFAGSLSFEPEAGTVVVDGDKRWMERVLDAGLRHLPIGSIDYAVYGTQSKMRLREQLGVVVVDMESACVWNVCRRYQLPFLAIRVISDDLRDDMPFDLTKLLSKQGRLGPVRMAVEIMGELSRIKDFVRFSVRCLQYRRRLANVIWSLAIEGKLFPPAELGHLSGTCARTT